MIPQETVDLILDTARIEDVISDFVTLRRRGASFVACCPFHNEKTPSFYVTPSKNLFKCFGCGKAGSAVGFVMEYEHLSYVDALRYLARKYHIDIVEEEQSAEEIALKQHRESLILVSEFAAKFYASQLKQGEGLAVGYRYLRSRSITDETIAAFGLGWAPEDKTALIDAALGAGYKMEYLLDAGLAVKREDGSFVDKFRGRAMFPIHTVSGRVIAFSGRTLHSDIAAKYLNSPDSEIYTKSKILLGIYFAKSEISRQGKCIVVEGNVDMVMMHQLGITNVVASCGTSLTVEQVRLIHKFTENATIMYDGDSAGIHAAIRGLGLFLAEGLNVKIVLLPEGEDPDSFCRQHTLAEVQDYIARGEKDFIAFKTDLLLAEAAGDPLKKANLINDIADTIAEIPDAVKRSVYVDATAQKFGIESSILFERINKGRRKMQEDVRPEYQEEIVPLQSGWVEENKTLAPAERDLLNLILTYGCEPLDFESDSEYYSGFEDDKLTVADFIRAALDGDASRLANSAYADAYDAYMALYDEGLSQQEIVTGLLNSSDRRVADIVAELSTEKYQLTVSDYAKALTTVSSWLVANVPKTILVYNEKRIQDRINGILSEMKTAAPEDETALMKDLIRYQNAQRKIKQKLGREKKNK